MVLYTKGKITIQCHAAGLWHLSLRKRFDPPDSLVLKLGNRYNFIIVVIAIWTFLNQNSLTENDISPALWWFFMGEGIEIYIKSLKI